MLQEICHRTPADIYDAATIDRELEMESVQMVELQVAIETEFDITLDFLEVLRLNSFRRVTDYIHELACARAGGSS